MNSLNRCFDGVVVAAASIAASSAMADDRDRFLELLDRATPKKGGWMVLYEFRPGAPNTWGRELIAYDIATGANFRIHDGRFGGQTADGRVFGGEQGKAPEINNPAWNSTTIGIISQRSGVPIARAILADPTLLISVTRSDNGGWDTTVVAPGRVFGAPRGSMKSPADANAQYDMRWTSDGRLEWIQDFYRRGDEWLKLPTPTPYALDPRLPEIFQIRDRRIGPNDEWAIFSKWYEPNGWDPRMFEPNAVAALAIKVDTKIPDERTPIEITRQSPIPDRILPGTEGSAKPGDDLARYRWPIVTGGAILIGVGLFAWWRNRR